MNPRKYTIAEGSNRFAKRWINREVTWEELAQKLRTPAVSTFTMAEYLALGKDRQTDVKDVGGVVCGYLRDGIRKKGNMESRSVITLDYDSFTTEQLERLRETLPFVWLLHTTMKSTPEAMRVRIYIPAMRDMDPEEYEAISRRIASRIGFRGIDRSTFEACRMMFWPCVCKDTAYHTEESNATNLLEPDTVLGTFPDWRDQSCWDFLPEERKALDLFGTSDQIERQDAPAKRTREEQAEAERIWAALAGSGRGRKRQQDPLTKRGMIGAFCRAYTVPEAIDVFLGSVYERSRGNRYTHIGSSTKGGAWVLDRGRFLYSFHATDPVYGRLLNAFDLVRLHLFGHLDEGCGDGTRADRLPSVRAMEELAQEDSAVKRLIVEEKRKDFEGVTDGKDAGRKVKDDAERLWEEKSAEMDLKGGEVKSTTGNIVKILTYHPDFAGKIRYNEFSNRIDVTGRLPWKRVGNSGGWDDKDDANLRVYLEARWSITGKEKIADAMTSVMTANSYHPVREYLEGLTWDGEKRLDGLYTDVLGARDTPLNRRLAVLTFTGAVARILDPGCKFDYFIILQGPEGTRKSTLFSLMGGKWFTDSITTIEGKDGMDALRGKWIAEMSELKAAKKSDAETIKAFISRQTDSYRPAYGRHTIDVPRQCIMVGTTNESAFLFGINTGNRRSPIVAIDPTLRKCAEGVPEYVTKWRDQLWAEAVSLYRGGSRLYLDDAMAEEARRVQEEFNFDLQDSRWDDVRAFLDFYVPDDWDIWTDRDKAAWYDANPGGGGPNNPMCSLRQRITVPEILLFCFGMERSAKDWRTRGREVGDFLNRSNQWEKIGAVRYCQKYLVKTWQRVFVSGNNNEIKSNKEEYLNNL